MLINLITRIKRSMHLLRTPKHLFNEKILKLIYHAHIQSHIDYGLILWGSMTRQITYYVYNRYKINVLR